MEWVEDISGPGFLKFNSLNTSIEQIEHLNNADNQPSDLEMSVTQIVRSM